MAELPEFRAGQILSAAAMTAIAAELRRQGLIVGTPPINIASGDAGIEISTDLPEAFWIRVTGGGTSGKYDWTRVIGEPGGTWVDHPTGESGTAVGDDPAVEANQRADVPFALNPVVPARRDPFSHVLFFMSGKCPP
jgi:hypothetical protein